MLAVILAITLVILLLGLLVLGIFTSIGLGILSFGWLYIQGVFALLLAFAGFFVLLMTTGSFAVGGCVFFGPLAFFFTMIGAFISTLGF